MGKPKHQPQKWFLTHLPSTSSQPEQEPGKGVAEHSQRALCRPRVPPVYPSPKKCLQEFQPCSVAWAEGPKAEEWRRSQSLVARKEHGTVGTAWGGRGPVLQLPLGLEPHRLLHVLEAGARGSVASLPNLGSCRQATLSLAAPWLSAGSGRHL